MTPMDAPVATQRILLLGMTLMFFFYAPTPLGTFEQPKLLALCTLIGLCAVWLPALQLGYWGWLLIAGLAANTIFALDPLLALVGAAPRALGAATIALAALCFALARRLPDPQRAALLSQVVSIGAISALVLPAQWLLAQGGLSVPGFPQLLDGRAGGLIGSPNQAGTLYAALAVVALWQGGRRWLLLPLLGAVVLTGSRAAALSFVLLALWWLWRRSARAPARRVLLGAALLVPLVALLMWRGHSEASDSLRIGLSTDALTAFRAPALLVGGSDGRAAPDRWSMLRPLLGFGLDQQRAPLSAARPPERNRIQARGYEIEADRVHMAPLDLLLTTGVLGVLAALLWFSTSVWRAQSAVLPGAVPAAVAIVVANMVGFFGLVDSVLLGLLLGLAQPNRSVVARPRQTTVVVALLCAVVFGAAWALSWSRAVEAAAAQRSFQLADDAQARSDAAGRLCASAQRQPLAMSMALACVQAQMVVGKVDGLAGPLRLLQARLPGHPRVWLLSAWAAMQNQQRAQAAHALQQYARCVEGVELWPEDATAYRAIQAQVQAWLDQPEQLESAP